MAVVVTDQPSTFGSKLVLDTAPTNTATVARDSGGVLHMVEIDNSSYNTAVYLKIADATSATAGTTAATMVFYCPAGTKQSYISARGITFGNGFTHWCVTGAAQANTGAPVVSPTIRYVIV